MQNIDAHLDGGFPWLAYPILNDCTRLAMVADAAVAYRYDYATTTDEAADYCLAFDAGDVLISFDSTGCFTATPTADSTAIDIVVDWLRTRVP